MGQLNFIFMGQLKVDGWDSQTAMQPTFAHYVMAIWHQYYKDIPIRITNFFENYNKKLQKNTINEFFSKILHILAMLNVTDILNSTSQVHKNVFGNCSFLFISHASQINRYKLVKRIYRFTVYPQPYTLGENFFRC